MIDGILIELPIKTRSPNGGNPGNRWAAIVQSREKKAHRTLARQVLGAALARRGLRGTDFVPVLVTITRISFGCLDDDNVAFACKAARDGIADALGINDGDRDRLRFHYTQRKGKRGEHRLEILIEQAATAAESAAFARTMVQVR